MALTITRFTVTPVPADLARQRAQQHLLGGLADRVRRHLRRAAPTATGGETASTRPQPRSTIPGTTACARWSVVHRCWSSIAADVGRIELRDRRAAGVATDEVDQHVHPPEGGRDGVDGGPGPVALPQVADAGHPAVVGQAEIAGHARESIAVRADQAEPRAVGGEDARRLPPEDAGGAGDEDDAVGGRACGPVCHGAVADRDPRPCDRTRDRPGRPRPHRYPGGARVGPSHRGPDRTRRLR